MWNYIFICINSYPSKITRLISSIWTLEAIKFYIMARILSERWVSVKRITSLSVSSLWTDFFLYPRPFIFVCAILGLLVKINKVLNTRCRLCSGCAVWSRCSYLLSRNFVCFTHALHYLTVVLSILVILCSVQMSYECLSCTVCESHVHSPPSLWYLHNQLAEIHNINACSWETILPIGVCMRYSLCYVTVGV